MAWWVSLLSSPTVREFPFGLLRWNWKQREPELDVNLEHARCLFGIFKKHRLEILRNPRAEDAQLRVLRSSLWVPDLEEVRWGVYRPRSSTWRLHSHPLSKLNLQTSTGAGLQAADVGKALQFLRKVIFVQDRVSSVLHHLQRHRPKD